MRIPAIQVSKLLRSAIYVMLPWVAGVSAVHAQHAPMPGEIVLSRYTTVPSVPDTTEGDPLAAIVHLQFPRSEIKTVGDAIRYLLLRTGYSLIESSQLDSTVNSVFSRPLPESHRDLGTYNVEAMLKVLMGKAFVLQIDSLRRTVSYVPNNEYEETRLELRSVR